MNPTGIRNLHDLINAVEYAEKMFKTEVYISRREKLKSLMKNGLALFPGNNDVAMNYSSNPYHFRQDSVFLYYFGLQLICDD